MLQRTFKNSLLLSLFVTAVNAAPVAVYDNWLNSSLSASKNSITAGATTATAKGYSAILSNPAGLSTNANITLYTKTITYTREDDEGKEIKEFNPEDNIAAGALYSSFGVEYKMDDYVAFGAAYGYETKYGLFSLGISYLMDQTDLTQRGGTAVATEDYATGDYSTVGVMWQKSFLDEDDFYAIYIGVSSKGYGVYDGDNYNDTTTVYTSPKKLSYGIGLETNIFDTSLLFTTDMFEEEGQNLKLSGMSHGLKWLIGEKFALGAGISNQSFSEGILTDIETVGAGVEFGFLIMHFNVSATQRTVESASGVYLKEVAGHLDLAFTF